MLGDAAGLSGSDARFPDRVQKRRFTVVYMSHNNNHGWPFHRRFIVFRVILIVEQNVLIRNHDLLLRSDIELACDQGGRIEIDYLILVCHDAHQHQLFDDIRRGFFDSFSKILDRHGFRQLYVGKHGDDRLCLLRRHKFARLFHEVLLRLRAFLRNIVIHVVRYPVFVVINFGHTDLFAYEFSGRLIFIFL